MLTVKTRIAIIILMITFNFNIIVFIATIVSQLRFVAEHRPYQGTVYKIRTKMRYKFQI